MNDEEYKSQGPAGPSVRRPVGLRRRPCSRLWRVAPILENAVSRQERHGREEKAGRQEYGATYGARRDSGPGRTLFRPEGRKGHKGLEGRPGRKTTTCRPTPGPPFQHQMILPAFSSSVSSALSAVQSAFPCTLRVLRVNPHFHPSVSSALSAVQSAFLRALRILCVNPHFPN